MPEMTVLRRSLWNALLGTALVVAAILPVAASADSDQVGDQPSEVMFLDRQGDQLLLSLAADRHNGTNHADAEFYMKKKDFAPTLYQELGTWAAAPAAETTRVIDVGRAELWLGTEGLNMMRAQVLIEVLQNGRAITAVESGCLTLQGQAVAPQIIDIPAPLPAGELNPGDVLALRVSVRSGLALGCLGGSTGSKVRLEFDGATAPSSIDFAFGGTAAASSAFQFVGPSMVSGGYLYITEATVITTDIAADLVLASCDLSLTSPSGVQIATFGCSAGQVQFSGVPTSDPSLGTYKLHLIVVTTSGSQYEELLEFYSVTSLP